MRRVAAGTLLRQPPVVAAPRSSRAGRTVTHIAPHEFLVGGLRLRLWDSGRLNIWAQLPGPLRVADLAGLADALGTTRRGAQRLVQQAHGPIRMLVPGMVLTRPNRNDAPTWLALPWALFMELACGEALRVEGMAIDTAHSRVLEERTRLEALTAAHGGRAGLLGG